MVKIEIIKKEMINEIENCSGCNGVKAFGVSCSNQGRQEKCICINNGAPEDKIGLNLILLGEANLDEKSYFMNRKNPGRFSNQSVAYPVIDILDNYGDKQLKKDIEALKQKSDKNYTIKKKELILDAMQNDGCAFLDVCQCLSPRDDTDEDDIREYFKGCFNKFSLNILMDLCQIPKYPNALIVPCFIKLEWILEERPDLFIKAGKLGIHQTWKMKSKKK